MGLDVGIRVLGGFRCRGLGFRYRDPGFGIRDPGVFFHTKDFWFKTSTRRRPSGSRIFPVTGPAIRSQNLGHTAGYKNILAKIDFGSVDQVARLSPSPFLAAHRAPGAERAAKCPRCSTSPTTRTLIASGRQSPRHDQESVRISAGPAFVPMVRPTVGTCG